MLLRSLCASAATVMFQIIAGWPVGPEGQSDIPCLLRGHKNSSAGLGGGGGEAFDNPKNPNTKRTV